MPVEISFGECPNSVFITQSPLSSVFPLKQSNSPAYQYFESLTVYYAQTRGTLQGFADESLGKNLPFLPYDNILVLRLFTILQSHKMSV